MKILCLGNEFIESDSFAKKLGVNLNKSQFNFEIVNIKDSFELVNYLQIKERHKDMVILDVVENLKQPQLLKIDDLKESRILSAHDFDAGFFLKLLGNDVKIVGIPIKGSIKKVTEEVEKLLIS